MTRMLFNPYNGLPRSPQDILSDPAGDLMLDRAASVAPAQKEAAVDRLRAALPHIFAAFQDAKANGLPTLAIAARDKEDGGGKMYLTLNDPEDFLKDIAEATGVSFVLTEKQRMQYMAATLMSKFKL